MDNKHKSSLFSYFVFFGLLLIILAKIYLFNTILPDNTGTAKWQEIFSPIFKISIASFFAGFSLLFRNKWWTVGLLFIIDVWYLACAIYVAMHGIPLDPYAFTMASNMNGFWSSILGLLEWDYFIPFGLTTIYTIFLTFVQKYSGKNIAAGLSTLTASVIATVAGTYILSDLYTTKLVHFWHPFSTSARNHTVGPSYATYCRLYSFIHMAGLDINDYFIIKRGQSEQYITLSNEEQELALSRCRVGPRMASSQKDVDRRLIIILIESLEGWGVEMSMPNLFSFAKSRNSLFAPRTKCEVKFGVSSDGQLIVNTGLLPICEGATCFLYASNTYPSVVKSIITDNTCCIIPHEASVWNQTYMSLAYGYSKTVTTGETDESVFNKVIEQYKSGCQVIQAITLSSHVPFEAGNKNTDFDGPQNVPHNVTLYLKCLNLVDKALKPLLDIISNSKDEITLLITGDHSIFTKASIERDNARYHLAMPDETFSPGKYIPVIIYNKSIKENIYIEDECHQMDVYPTLLHCVGTYNTYFWKGLGRDLLSYDCLPGLDEDVAFELSDKMIRNNFFKTHQQFIQ